MDEDATECYLCDNDVDPNKVGRCLSVQSAFRTAVDACSHSTDACVDVSQHSSAPQHAACTCGVRFHICCLGKELTKNEDITVLIPTSGPCPSCSKVLLWGDLVRTVKLR